VPGHGGTNEGATDSYDVDQHIHSGYMRRLA
jgi:hypothetical protein